MRERAGGRRTSTEASDPALAELDRLPRPTSGGRSWAATTRGWPPYGRWRRTSRASPSGRRAHGARRSRDLRRRRERWPHRAARRRRVGTDLQRPAGGDRGARGRRRASAGPRRRRRRGQMPRAGGGVEPCGSRPTTSSSASRPAAARRTSWRSSRLPSGAAERPVAERLRPCTAALRPTGTRPRTSPARPAGAGRSPRPSLPAGLAARPALVDIAIEVPVGPEVIAGARPPEGRHRRSSCSARSPPR